MNKQLENDLSEQIDALELDDPRGNGGGIGIRPALQIVNSSSVKIEPEAVRVAHRAQMQILAASRRLTAAFIILARRLYEFDLARHWDTLGYESFWEWAESSECCTVGAETARQAVRIYAQLVIDLKVPIGELSGIGIAKFQIIMAGLRDDIKQLKDLRRQIDALPNYQERLAALPEYQRIYTSAQQAALEWAALAKTTSKSEMKKALGDRRGVSTLASQFVSISFFSPEQRDQLRLAELPLTDTVHVLIRSGLEKG